jgi:predicted nucleotidyltransferase
LPKDIFERCAADKKTTLPPMRANEEDRARLAAEAQRLAEQLKGLGARKIILFGSLARGCVSLFSDVDLLVVFQDSRRPRELTRWVYQNLDVREGVDILAYNQETFEKMRERPFLYHALKEGIVLYERPEE